MPIPKLQTTCFSRSGSFFSRFINLARLRVPKPLMQVKHKYRTKKLMHKTKSQDENVLINYVITFAVSLFKLALCPSMRRCTEVVPGTIQNAPTATPTALVVVHIVCALCWCPLLGYLAILGVRFCVI